MEKLTEPKASIAANSSNMADAYRHSDVIDARQAIQLLTDGNKRFMANNILKKDLSNQKRAELSKGQKPFAVILTCSDSRVPPELIFDQGLGDIFVIRTAGNIVDQISLGSIEYGVEHLNAPLLLVLGHEHCGAVQATVDGGEAPGSINALINKIKPSVERAKAGGASGNTLYEKSEDENIFATIADIEKSTIVEHLVASGQLKVIGAKYKLTTGEVVFFPGTGR